MLSFSLSGKYKAIGFHHDCRLFAFKVRLQLFFLKIVFHYVTQASLELMDIRDPLL